MKAEIERRVSNLDRVEAFFREQPGVWIHASAFEPIGGRQAWRSRVAECRTKRGMHIENRLDLVNKKVVASWYRYLPYTPIARDASEYTVTLPLFDQGHPRA
jgi:hypothetical protein